MNSPNFQPPKDSNTNDTQDNLNFSLNDFGFDPSDFDDVDEEVENSSKRIRTATGYRNSMNGSFASSSTRPSVLGENGLQEWHSEQDLQKRMEMTHRIMRLLQERKPEPCQKWLQELPHKALRLEKHLYKAAPSLEAYMDENTLKHRLRKVANAITTHIKLAKANHNHRQELNSMGLSDSYNTKIETSLNNQQQTPTQSVLPQQAIVSQKITQPLNNIASTKEQSKATDQEGMLKQMLATQKTFMELKSMNGETLSNEQQQLQQQLMLTMQQLNQLNQQQSAVVSPPAPANTNFNQSQLSITNGFNQVSNDKNQFNLNQPVASQFNTIGQASQLNFNQHTHNINQSQSQLNRPGISSASGVGQGSGNIQNDDELDIAFLQETFGVNNVAV